MGPAGSPSEPNRAWFQALFQQLPEGVVVHDGGRVLACNPAAADLFGRTPAEMEGSQVFDHVAATSKKEVSKRMSHPEPGGYAAMGRHKDGSDVPLRIRARELEGHPGVRLAIFSPLAAEEQDLEEIRLALEQRDEVLRLQETSRFKTQILNTTAHELNTPLTPVRLQLHLLKTGALGQLSQRHEKAVGIIDRNIERLSVLVNDILDVARLESGRLEVKRQPMPLEPVLQETLESFEETARRVGVALELADGPNLTLDADKDRITQVVFNLVGNALKFTPEGGTVTVRAKETDGAARVEVIDTGPGLDADQIDRLFEPFSRVHDTTRTAIAGTGLGLYICKGLIDAHDGHIEALSDGPGKGATFAITVPLSDQHVTQPAPRTSSKRALDPLAQRLRELI